MQWGVVYMRIYCQTLWNCYQKINKYNNETHTFIWVCVLLLTIMVGGVSDGTGHGEKVLFTFDL